MLPYRYGRSAWRPGKWWVRGSPTETPSRRYPSGRATYQQPFYNVKIIMQWYVMFKNQFFLKLMTIEGMKKRRGGHRRKMASTRISCYFLKKDRNHRFTLTLGQSEIIVEQKIIRNILPINFIFRPVFIILEGWEKEGLGHVREGDLLEGAQQRYVRHYQQIRLLTLKLFVLNLKPLCNCQYMNKYIKVNMQQVEGLF